jgi:SPP1 Gp6-like portal protein
MSTAHEGGFYVASEADQALSQMCGLYKRLCYQREFACRMDEAYRGKHKLFYASDKWREYHSARYKDFSDNWCSPVANSPNERLRIDGFRLDDDPQQTGAEKQLWRDWQTNELEVQSSQGFLQSIIAARSAVLVWGDADDNPVVTWEHPAETIVHRDPENPRWLLAALKTWCDDDTEYATLYTDEAVWKWQRPYTPPHVPAGAPPAVRGFFYNPSGVLVPNQDGGQWTPRQPKGDDTWPLGNPLGEVPFAEFPNRPMLGGEPISEIAGTLSMQHAINLLWAYLFNAADHASFPARVVMGQEPPKLPILDEQGQKQGEKSVDLKKLAEDRILWLTGEDAKIGQWDPAKLEPFTNVIETAVSHIAAQTRTPPHYLILGQGMVNISADGMRAAEAGLVAKVTEAQTFWTPPTRKLFRLMALVRGNEGVAEQCQYGAVQWKNAENRSQAQLVDSLLKLQTMGFPFQWLAEQYGLSETELARVIELKQSEAEHDPVGMLSRQLEQQQARQLPAAPSDEAA